MDNPDSQDAIRLYRQPSPHLLAINGCRLEIFFGEDLPCLGEAVQLTPAFATPAESSTTIAQAVFAEVRAHLGSGRVRAWILEPPPWLEAGASAKRTHDFAAVIKPDPAHKEPSLGELNPRLLGDPNSYPLRLSPPCWSKLDPHRPALQTGWAMLDGLAPLCEKGVNFILDASIKKHAIGEIAQRVIQATQPHRMIDLGIEALATGEKHERKLYHAPQGREIWRLPRAESTIQKVLLLRVLGAWVNAWRAESTHQQETIDAANSAGELPLKLLVVADLPLVWDAHPKDDYLLGSAHESTENEMRTTYREMVDLLGGALSSTPNMSVTTLLRVALGAQNSIGDIPEGLDTVAETLAWGQVDTQIYVDLQGRFDPLRSTSNAERSGVELRKEMTLRRKLSNLEQRHEREMIFGSEEEDAENSATAELEAFRPSLLPRANLDESL